VLWAFLYEMGGEERREKRRGERDAKKDRVGGKKGVNPQLTL
tara:strand:- start:548 stop:673 length:126 start_codon:yes stop_codon:yes gene_type:complete